MSTPPAQFPSPARSDAPIRAEAGAEIGAAPWFDVVIFGAGVAGLWTACRLSDAGFRVLVLERGEIGQGQTIGSQGIIHGGIKYALTGEASRASAAIARMPEVWRRCLQGEGEIDLSGVQTLSPEQYLWTTPGIASRLAGLGASKVIRTPVERVPSDQPPPAPLLAGAPRGGVLGVGGVDVYRVAEPVLETHSIVMALTVASRSRGVAIIHAPRVSLAQPESRVPGGEWRIEVARSGAPDPIAIPCRAVVFCAGEQNEALARGAGLIGPDDRIMQLRPLHMAIARNAPGPLFGHCLGTGTTPRLTITAFPCDALPGPGATTWGWSIGGEIAESGVARSEAEQIAAVRDELASCLKWLDLSGLRLATIRWNRAEGLTPDGVRPDEPVVRNLALPGNGPALVAWPTKLAFAPELAGRVEAALRGLGCTPGALANHRSNADARPGAAAHSAEAQLVAAGLGAARVCPPLWQRSGLQWR
ncbi:MAG TPA: FAD-dependent oxidoreductase [Phycisphaerales bacterium]|nr:FAD-dependent oxidoreductase [Phycisphaerales bacterium]